LRGKKFTVNRLNKSCKNCCGEKKICSVHKYYFENRGLVVKKLLNMKKPDEVNLRRSLRLQEKERKRKEDLKLSNTKLIQDYMQKIITKFQDGFEQINKKLDYKELPNSGPDGTEHGYQLDIYDKKTNEKISFLGTHFEYDTYPSQIYLQLNIIYDILEGKYNDIRKEEENRPIISD